METTAKSRLLDQLTAKRQLYRRCQTVAYISVNRENKHTVNVSSSAPLLRAAKLSGEIVSNTDDQNSSSSCSSLIRGNSELVEEWKRSGQHYHQQHQDRSVSPRGGSHRGGCPAQGGVNPLSHRASGGGDRTPKHPWKLLDRTPSSPSILLSKVREKIRERVIETAVEWPSVAAIVQERRLKAASAYEAQLTQQTHLEIVDEDGEGSRRPPAARQFFAAKRVLGQTMSQSTDAVSCSAAGRAPLKRRSRSSDAFASLPGTGAKGDREEEVGSRVGKLGGGVVCTETDLKSILRTFRKETASVPSVETEQTSADVSEVVVPESLPRGYNDNLNPAVIGAAPGLPPEALLTKDRKLGSGSENPGADQCHHRKLCRSTSAKNASSLSLTSKEHSSVRKCVSLSNAPSTKNSLPSTHSSPSCFHSSKCPHQNLPELHHQEPPERPEDEHRLSTEPESSRSRQGRSELSSDSNGGNSKCLNVDLFDPVIIGQAIEFHLETIMRTRAVT